MVICLYLSVHRTVRMFRYQPNQADIFVIIISICLATAGPSTCIIQDGANRELLRDTTSFPSILVVPAVVVCCGISTTIGLFLMGSFNIATSVCTYRFTILNVFHVLFAPTYWNPCHSFHHHYHIVSEGSKDYRLTHVLYCPCCPTLAGIPNFYSIVPP